MKSYRIGDVIKRHRKLLGLTQEQLCDGICDPTTLSKIENGRRTPSPQDTIGLLERLGLSSDVYYFLVSDEDFAVQDLKVEIRTHAIRKEFSEALDLLDKLEAYKRQSPFVAQFILRQRSIVGYRKDGAVCPYTPAEALELLYQAIRLTVSSFQIERIAEYLLCTEELTVIIDIAASHSDQEDYDTSLRIYAQLMNYVEQRCMSTEETNRIFPLIAYNYARDLEEVGDYAKAVEVSEQGRQYCIRYGKANLLGVLLATQGCALYKQGKHKEGLQTLGNACMALRLMEKADELAFLQKYIKNLVESNRF